MSFVFRELGMGGMGAKKRRRAPTNPLQKANAKSDDEFVRDYLFADKEYGQWDPKWKHPSTGKMYNLVLVRSELMTDADLLTCLDLIELTSGEDYKNSTMGWNRDRKLKEMKSADLRYILVRAGDDEAGPIVAFTSLMPTFEAGQPVVYCYEIHIQEEVRGGGLGSLLLGYLSNVAASLPPIKKVMLTCFVANAGALAFYKKLGFSRDEISPEPRRLRNGQGPDPDYVILSKVVHQRLNQGDDGAGSAADAAATAATAADAQTVENKKRRDGGASGGTHSGNAQEEG